MKTNTTKNTNNTSTTTETKEENTMTVSNRHEFDFFTDRITVNGKTFPASYEMQEHKIRIAATVDGGKIVYIDVPETDVNYMLVYAVADEASRADASSMEEQPAQEEQPAAPVEDQQEEQPAQEDETQEGGKGWSKEQTVEYIRRVTEAGEMTLPEAAEELHKLGEIKNPDADLAADYLHIPTEDAPAVEEERPAPVTVEEQPDDERPETISDDAPAYDPKQARGPVPEKAFAGEAISGRGWSIVFDTGMQRTRVIISDPIREKAAPIIEKAGFYYSRPMNSYNKKLTFRAYRAAVALADALRAALA